MKTTKHHVCALDPENGFFVQRIRSRQHDRHPVVMVAPFRDAKRFSDIMNKQFEIL